VRLSQHLAHLGYAPRRDCERWIAARRVTDASGRPLGDRDPFVHEDVRVDGVPLDPPPGVVVLLHKPAGYVCSTRPRHHPGVLGLLPLPLRLRGVQPVGRLDADTTGLLLLTDDGPLIHALTSPRRKVPKVYEVRTRHPVDPAQVTALAQGVVWRDDPAPARASDVTITGTRGLRLTLSEGRYHQVKRMVAAVATASRPCTAAPLAR